MGNRKILTAVLLVAAATIWILVICKATGLTEREQETANPVKESNTPVPEHLSGPLLLDYPDPFLKSLEQKPLHPRQESDASRMPEADPPAPGFRFNGIVSDGDETYALVSGAGETILVKGNAKIGDYTVIGFSSREMTLDIYGKRITLTL